MKQYLTRCAQGRCLAHLILIPLSWLFALLSSLRRWAYGRGLLASERLPVPVVVVGNITAGGSGKTPLAIWLVRALMEAGWRPGVISRGYGGRDPGPRMVNVVDDPAEVGDEPLLLARTTGVPVCIGRRRARAGQALLAAAPQVNVLVADDGLQHYALARDVEIAVVDARRRFGNGRLLPAGPLREPVGRLRQVDVVVVNGGESEPAAVGVAQFPMLLEPKGFRKLGDSRQLRDADNFLGRPVHAVAGIGNPERFFSTLRDMGIEASLHTFPDHHAYTRGDLPAGTLLMTSKDAVKCERFGLPDAWALEVDAVVRGALKDLLSTKLKACHGSQAT